MHERRAPVLQDLIHQGRQHCESRPKRSRGSLCQLTCEFQGGGRRNKLDGAPWVDGVRRLSHHQLQQLAQLEDLRDKPNRSARKKRSAMIGLFHAVMGAHCALQDSFGLLR